MDIHLSSDDFLLQKVLPAEKIKRHIDWTKLGITKESIQQSASEKYSGWDKNQRNIDKRIKPSYESEEEQDKFYITELCHPYSPKPDDRDIFLFYWDIQCLSGTAGYIRIRDGYVWGRIVTTVS